MRTCRTYLGTGLLVLAATLSAGAASVSFDFNSGALPAGTHTNSSGSGGAYLETTGGTGNSGCLKLTKNQNDQHGSFILDDIDAGSPIYGFDATFKIRIGGGGNTPADALSFSVAPAGDISDTAINLDDFGIGSGLRFSWATYPNSGRTPPDPAVRVVGSGNAVLAWKGYTVSSLSTGGTDPSTWWADVHIHLNADGSLTFDYKGQNIVTNWYVPGYQAFVNQGSPVRFAFGARTGGANDNFWIDDLQITTVKTPLVGISQQPFNQTAQQGDTIDFDVRINNPDGVTLQWYSNNVAIPGATGQTLTLANVQAAASGSKYKVTATGPNNTVTSTEVTLTVTNLTVPAPQLSFNFNDGATPTGVTLTGTAIVDTLGGVANSGCVKLVAPAGSAAMLVADSTPTSPLYGFTARFKMLVGGGTVPPADGFAFAFGSDIPDAPAGDFETGAGLGSGLRVTFDIYNNDGIFGFRQYEDTPAPSIDVRYGSQILGTVQLPISFMESGLNPDTTPAYTDVIIQLNTDGTLNVVYHGDLVFDHLPIPAFGSFGPSSNTTGSRFAIAARTGGLNDNIWLDDFQLTTVTTPGAVRITTQPLSQNILVNHSMTNTVAVNDATGVTYQWYRGATAIGGATDSSYVLPSVAVSDSGAAFTVQATKASVTVTSAVATLTVVNLTAPASPDLTFDFNNGATPPNTAIYGTGDTANGLPPGGFITTTGGVGDSGVLHITDAVNGQQGAFVIQPLFSGAQIAAIAAAFDVRIGGGSAVPADGWSFNFAPDLTDACGGNETGNGTGLSVCMRIYVGNGSADNPPSPYIAVRYKGAVIASIQTPASELVCDPAYRTVLLRVDQDGKLYLSYGERVLWNGLQLPNYTFTAAGKFGIYGRTGGLNANQWFDNIRIQATKSSGPLTITTQPANALVIAGSTATFSVGLSDPNGATYQWSKNGGTISGATLSAYTTPATTLADNGALFSVKATGPGGTATSSNALLTVVAPITISNPTVTYDFNDCQIPLDTIVNFSNPDGQHPGGGGYVNCTGGVGDSGVLHLTDNVNDCHSAFIMPDPNTNQPIQAFTAYFAVRIADGSGTPADGFSFCWAPSNAIPDNAIFGQGGIGGHLVVGFDTYNNSGEAPSFNVWYEGNQLANKLVPYSWLWTGGNSSNPLLQYGDVFIRVNATGTLDLQYNGRAIFSGLVLPGYSALAGGRFAIGAQTGGENETHWFDNIKIATTTGQISVPIGFTRSGNQLTLTWPAGWKLQSTGSLSPANWQDVTGASSPYPVSTSTGTQFYRLAPTP